MKQGRVMTEELKNKTALTPLDARLDGFDGFEDAVEGTEQVESRGVIRGICVKYTNEATWITSDNGEELPPEFEPIVVDVARVVQRWKDSRPIETIILAPGQKFPAISALNAKVPQEEWEEGP